jgi:hypothetical protein
VCEHDCACFALRAVLYIINNILAICYITVTVGHGHSHSHSELEAGRQHHGA